MVAHHPDAEHPASIPELHGTREHLQHLPHFAKARSKQHWRESAARGFVGCTAWSWSPAKTAHWTLTTDIEAVMAYNAAGWRCG